MGERAEAYYLSGIRASFERAGIDPFAFADTELIAMGDGCCDAAASLASTPELAGGSLAVMVRESGTLGDYYVCLWALCGLCPNGPMLAEYVDVAAQGAEFGGEPTSTTTGGANTTAGTDLPTYEEIVATYPSWVEICTVEARLYRDTFEIVAGALRPPASRPVGTQEHPYMCFGTRVTVEEELRPEALGGALFEIGALLTVDAEFAWIEIQPRD